MRGLLVEQDAALRNLGLERLSIRAGEVTVAMTVLPVMLLLVLAPLASLSLAGQEHGRTIPLADIDLHKATLLSHQISFFLNTVRGMFEASRS
jgi:hypothetical protein